MPRGQREATRSRQWCPSGPHADQARGRASPGPSHHPAQHRGQDPGEGAAAGPLRGRQGVREPPRAPGPPGPGPPAPLRRAGPTAGPGPGQREQKAQERKSCTTVVVLSPVLLFWGSGSGRSRGEKRDRLVWEQDRDRRGMACGSERGLRGQAPAPAPDATLGATWAIRFSAASRAPCP